MTGQIVSDRVQDDGSRWRGPSRREFLRALTAVGASAGFLHGSVAAQTPSSSAGPSLIDLHHHILPPAYLSVVRDMLIASWKLKAQPHSYLPARVLEWSPQHSLVEMDRNGVATSIVSISAPGIWFGDAQSARALARNINEYAAQLAKDYPGRFGFFATVPLPDTEGSLREIAYALDVLKADGIGFSTNYGDKWPGDPAYAPVFDELNRRKAVVYFHPTGPMCCRDLIPNVPYVLTELPHDTTRAITSLLFSGSFARLRDIRFIFSHAGGTVPMLADRISQYSAQMESIASKVPKGVEYELKRLFYEIASSANPPAMAALMKLVSTSQILFGSDYPYVPIALTTSGLTHLGLSPPELRAIGCGNAAALFPRWKARD
jgi:predicted TIM-barrel fold metal-dependent hydrolase